MLNKYQKNKYKLEFQILKWKNKFIGFKIFSNVSSTYLLLILKSVQVARYQVGMVSVLKQTYRMLVEYDSLPSANLQVIEEKTNLIYNNKIVFYTPTLGYQSNVIYMNFLCNLLVILKL